MTRRGQTSPLDGDNGLSLSVTNVTVQPMAVSMVAAINAYLAERYGRGEIVRSTRARQRYTLRMVADHAKNPPVDRLRVGHADRWLQSIRDQVAPSTLYTYTRTVKTFGRWLARSRLVTRDPFETLTVGRRPRSAPRQLSRTDVAKILAACADDRERLMVTLMDRLAMRASSVAWLRWEGVDEGAGEVRFKVKGGGDQLMPLPGEVVAALEAWHRAWPTARVGPVIRSYRVPSQGIDPQWVSKTVARICREAGVHVTAHDGRTGHALRHGRAGVLIRAGAGMPVVQRTLGHQHLASTAVYVPSVEVAELRGWLDPT